MFTSREIAEALDNLDEPTPAPEPVRDYAAEWAASHTERLYVRNLAQKILFDKELCGQISDGFWENASPREHWIPWCNATVVVRPEFLGRNFRAHKDNYRINSAELLDIVGDRMLEEVQAQIPGYGRKDMMRDLADLRKIMKMRAI
jgi:hypothetical protein